MNTAVSRALRTPLRTSLKACAIAAVLAGASSSAFAQSSVQLYGQVDEWVGATRFPGSQTAWNVGGGGMSTSYWGLKGSEDLGGGYKAIFALESFFRAQNGQDGRFSGDTFFARNAYVGLESPYGTFTAGRLTTQLFVSTILFNPFIDSYTFSPMVYHVYLGLSTYPTYTTDQGVVGDSGWNNAVQYSTPNFNGLSGSVMYALGNQAGDNGKKKWSAQALYFHGPFAATAVYQYVNFNSTPGDIGSIVSGEATIVGLRSQGVAQVGLSYDLKYVKFFGQYMYTNNNSDISSWHVNTAQGGVSVPAGPGTVMASYAYSRDSGGLNQTHNTAAVGYDYPLSKRTDVYAAYMYDHYDNMSSGMTYGVGLRAKF
ncbi:MAG: porin [Paraburkholderia tropica]|uniref:Porin n=1 Tax=Paraburkholderia tropica TaxID=92647 RepID=A0ABX5MWY8_9BURK|nr:MULTISPECIES: porin [Paraburkholderia]MDE1142270.1 porin [Paraburkholderia tropica]PXX20390.1 putative porin [Paraburkholderia tropica]PZW89468.1 putative porin [Paraburkholderia tropica]RQM48922.1 porin [Paraburkholderia bannensis]